MLNADDDDGIAPTDARNDAPLAVGGADSDGEAPPAVWLGAAERTRRAGPAAGGTGGTHGEEV